MRKLSKPSDAGVGVGWHKGKKELANFRILATGKERDTIMRMLRMDATEEELRIEGSGGVIILNTRNLMITPTACTTA